MRIVAMCSNKYFQQIVCYCYELVLVVTIMYGFFGFKYEILDGYLGMARVIFQVAVVGVLIIYLRAANSKIKSIKLKTKNSYAYEFLSKREIKILNGGISFRSKIYIIIFSLISLLYFFNQKEWSFNDLVIFLLTIVVYFLAHVGLEMWRTGNLIETKIDGK